MARRRVSLVNSVTLVAVLAVAPVAAQSTNVATPTPTPSPAPTGNAVGPPTLRDFNLNGTVTQPAQPANPTPAPAERPAAPSQSAPAGPRPTPTPAPVVAAPGPATAAPDRDPAPGTATIDLPAPTAAPLAAEPSFAPALEPATSTQLAADERGLAWWPWLAALAVALGGAFIWWRRKQQGGQRYAADHADPGALVAPPVAAPPPLPRTAAPMPAPRANISTPVPTPPAAPVPDGIFASRLKPQIEFELVPIRAETDAAEGAALTFDIIVVNRGSAPARDVLVEAQLINAGPQVDAEVGRFFMRPAGNGERVPVIPPMGRVAIKTRLAVPGANLAPLVVEGRKLLVPLIAINAVYRWSGGELKDSSSFLVGRGEADEGKLAPFRLDRGARSWSGLAARLHSSGLQR